MNNQHRHICPVKQRTHSINKKHSLAEELNSIPPHILLFADDKRATASTISHPETARPDWTKSLVFWSAPSSNFEFVNSASFPPASATPIHPVRQRHSFPLSTKRSFPSPPTPTYPILFLSHPVRAARWCVADKEVNRTQSQSKLHEDHACHTVRHLSSRV